MFQVILYTVVALDVVVGFVVPLVVGMPVCLVSVITLLRQSPWIVLLFDTLVAV